MTLTGLGPCIASFSSAWRGTSREVYLTEKRQQGSGYYVEDFFAEEKMGIFLSLRRRFALDLCCGKSEQPADTCEATLSKGY